MIIITGTGRCGTTLLAQFCTLVGYDTGGLPERKEDYEVIEINNAIKCGMNLTGQTSRKVIKDPNFFNFPYLIDRWPGEKSYLLIKREPRDVLKSANLLDYYEITNNLEEKEFEELVNKREKEFFEKIKDSDYRVIFFPDIIDDYDQVYYSLTELGLRIDYEEGKTIWKNLATHQKVHFIQTKSNKA